MTFIVITLLNKNYKKIKQNIIDVDLTLLKNHNLKFKEFKNRVVVHQKQALEGPEDPRLFYYKNDIFILKLTLDNYLPPFSFFPPASPEVSPKIDASHVSSVTTTSVAPLPI